MNLLFVIVFVVWLVVVMNVMGVVILIDYDCGGYGLNFV